MDKLEELQAELMAIDKGIEQIEKELVDNHEELENLGGKILSMIPPSLPPFMAIFENERVEKILRAAIKKQEYREYPKEKIKLMQEE